MTEIVSGKPDRMVSVRSMFGIDSGLTVPAFSERDDHVPDIDEAYRFNPEVTLAILAGFTRDRRVMVQGLHGTGKSTHIEQVAARLNWPCVRVNLDGHISRLDLVGKDAIVVRDDLQVTEFQEGIVPWALQRPVALIFDEYDAGRPDVMFVIQRILERDGKFTLLDQNRVIHPHPYFRMFATTNTVGLGNLNGLYHGTQVLNHAQMDRWNVVATLNYLPRAEEAGIVLARVPELADDAGRALIESMVSVAELTRKGFAAGDLSTLMSPRTVINWAENCQIFRDPAMAFRLTFLNKCDEAERPAVAEYFQRCFGYELEARTRNERIGIALMSTDRQAARRAEERERLCAAAVRALTGDAALHYRDGRLCRGYRPLPLNAPHLRTDREADDFASLRGAADGAALRLIRSDASLHRRLCPADPLARLVFELLEQLRCETQTPPGMPGVVQNLRHRFAAWSRAFYRSGPDRRPSRHPALHRRADGLVATDGRTRAGGDRRTDRSDARRHRARARRAAGGLAAASRRPGSVRGPRARHRAARERDDPGGPRRASAGRRRRRGRRTSRARGVFPVARFRR